MPVTPSPSPAAATIGLVHATLAAVQPMVDAFRECAPGTALLHFLDEGLLPLVNREGLSGRAVAELERLINRAIASGADGILLTCSSYSPVVPAIQLRSTVPLQSVDESMLRKALRCGSRIGIVATVEAAGPTTEALLRQYAIEAQQEVSVETRVVPAAFAALKSGDEARHDALIQEKIAELLPLTDVIVLAQISMARALAPSPVHAKPVLSSPRSAVESMLGKLRPPR